MFNSVCHHCRGTSGCLEPVDVLQRRESLELSRGVAWTVKEVDVEDCSARICWSTAWALDIAMKSTVGG